MGSIVKKRTNKLQNLFHTILVNPINKRRAPEKRKKKTLRLAKMGGGARAGVGLTAVKDSMVFKKLSITKSVDKKIKMVIFTEPASTPIQFSTRNVHYKDQPSKPLWLHQYL